MVEELASRLIDDLGLEGTLAFSTNGVRSNTVEVVEPGATIKLVSQEVEKINDLVGWPADDESTAYDQRRVRVALRLDLFVAALSDGNTWRVLDKKLSYADKNIASAVHFVATRFNDYYLKQCAINIHVYALYCDVNKNNTC